MRVSKNKEPFKSLMLVEKAKRYVSKIVHQKFFFKKSY